MQYLVCLFSKHGCMRGNLTWPDGLDPAGTVSEVALQCYLALATPARPVDGGAVRIR